MAYVGRKHADRFYDWMELPRKVQKFYDWAEDSDASFVRAVLKNGREEFIPLENFIRQERSPSGLKIDGFATDSYFSGHAIKFNTPRSMKAGLDYEVWMETT